MVVDEREAELRRYLTLIVGAETFAAKLGSIREVINCPRLTRVPLTPAQVPGVINLRGSVVPVVDLASRLGRSATVAGKRSCIVVIEVSVEGRTMPIGLLVDAVEAALEAQADAIEPRPAFGVSVPLDFVDHMLRLGQRFVPVLQLPAVADCGALEELVRGHARRAEPAVS